MAGMHEELNRHLHPAPEERPAVADVAPSDVGVWDRFWAKVDKSGECWLWTGNTYRDGYGQFHVERRQVRAHRWSYEQALGPIPEGLVIDHLCRVRLCVNPSHLEAVTNQENLRRGKALIVACPANHPYDEANTRINTKGHRVCRVCHKERSRAFRRAQAARTAEGASS